MKLRRFCKVSNMIERYEKRVAGLEFVCIAGNSDSPIPLDPSINKQGPPSSAPLMVLVLHVLDLPDPCFREELCMSTARVAFYERFLYRRTAYYLHL